MIFALPFFQFYFLFLWIFEITFHHLVYYFYFGKNKSLNKVHFYDYFWMTLKMQKRTLLSAKNVVVDLICLDSDGLIYSNFMEIETISISQKAMEAMVTDWLSIKTLLETIDFIFIILMLSYVFVLTQLLLTPCILTYSLMYGVKKNKIETYFYYCFDARNRSELTLGFKMQNKRFNFDWMDQM